MPYRGRIKNGMVILDEVIPLPEGTPVIIEPVVTENRAENRATGRNWKGIFHDTGPVPTEADIAEMRREAWPQS